MRFARLGATVMAALALSIATAVRAGPDPAPRPGDFVIHDFRFHTGQVLPALRIHYQTLGEPGSTPVLLLHGTAGSGSNFLAPGFAGELFGPGQPLDARTHYIILPDAIGAGGSSKPSDGLRTAFPAYDYSDMVRAQFELVTQGLGVHHLRLVLGNSMGGMHAWLWGEQHPDFMDLLVPMASQPSAMSGRNWMLRRLLIESIRRDPDWNQGHYRAPLRGLPLAAAWFGVATSGGTLAYQQAAPTRAAADRLVDERLQAAAEVDANDFLYQWEASGDYDPAPDLERIRARVLAINSADDERNPPELGVMERALARLPDARLYLIPASADTRGHGTTALARFWQAPLRDLLQGEPRR